MKQKNLIIIGLIFTFLFFILISLNSKNTTVSSNIKSSCDCFYQGYNSGLKGVKDLYGCYKGSDGSFDVRKAFNEGYWFGSEFTTQKDFDRYKQKYCGY